MKEFLKLFFLIYFISQISCECPSYCECEGGDSICTSCLDRHFYGDSCDKPCNESRINCEECEMDSGKCSKCKDNKYKGPNCEENCNDKCPGGECVPEDGTCYEGDCEESLYYGNECDIPCSKISDHCEKCHRDGTCISCTNEDYHGIFCNITCPGCPDKKCDDEGICEDKEGNCENDDYYGVNCENNCIDINSNCLKCNRTRNCYLCRDEHFFGTECNDDCSVCPDGLCYNSGECKDPHGNCKDNATYGLDCKEPCTNIDGNCKECNRNRTCVLCGDKAFYGDECKTPCYCPDKKCEVDGTCEDSSNDCFNEIFFGTKCNQLCNETRDNCVKCHREGECFACTNETYYGKDCEQKCDNCPEKKCDINGKCSEEGDCINMEFYGGFCNDTCISDDRPRCQECHRNNSCTKCNTFNYYGPDCNDYCLLCPENECEIDGKCKIPDKNCYENKTHGDYCNENCTDINENCIKCDREGVCIECLDSLYFGPRCEESCSRCPNNKCKINGDCEESDLPCTDPHFYGNNCSIPCNITNPNCDTCDKDGICLSCFNKEKYGPECETPCEYCPDNLCEIDGNCTDQRNDCFESKYYGVKCNQSCTELNENCLLCNRQEDCFECSNKTYYGDRCNKLCDKCPGKTCNNSGICNDTTSNCEDPTYTGPNCTQKCSVEYINCDKCDRDNICFECKSEIIYGKTCEDTCEQCPDEKEEKGCNIDGICKDDSSPCKNKSFTGENCTDFCWEKYDNCLECDRNNTCSECKNKTKYGPKCEDSCEECPGEVGCYIDGTCIDKDSACRNHSLTGENCTEYCWEKYENCFECERDNTCTKCKSNKIYGNNCTDSCEDCPGEEGCYMNGTCVDQINICNNNTKTGEKCDTPCDEIFNNTKRCDRNNIAIECIDQMFYGNYCNDSCANCPGDPGYCYTNGTCMNSYDKCDDDTLTGDGCNVNCSSLFNNTLRCDRNYNAIECINKTFYGEHCDKSCSNCPGNCTLDGICVDNITDCDDNTLTGKSCNESCKDIYNNTKKCHRNYIAIECIDQMFYGNYCDISCANCPGDPGFCDIYGNCLNSNETCDNDTFTGDRCDTPCNTINNNTLRCYRNHTAIECINKTFYGDYCKDSCANCPGNCTLDGICEDNSTDCDDTTFTGEKCSTKCNTIYNNTERCHRNNLAIECINKTFYGNYCDDSCANCPGDPGFCDINGTCYNLNETCDNDTFTGERCDILCNTKYNNTKRCDRNYIAIECIDQMFYGNYCDVSCANCPGDPGFCDIYGNCLNSNETCDNDSYTGDRCDILCNTKYNNTKRCYRNYIAIECIDQMFYGNYCDVSCANCPGDPGYCEVNGTCMNSSGICDDNTLSGERCDTPCSKEYNNTYRCDRSFISIECINKTFYGDYCNESCSNCPGNCALDGICEDNSTDCDDTTFTGEKCTTKCNSIYNNTLRCHRNYKAIECINKTFYGDYCNDSCANCPGNCNLDGVCDDSSTNCVNDSYTGSKCDELCLSIHNNSLRCDRKGISIECLNTSYYGDYCTDECFNCPKNQGNLGVCYINGTCNDSISLCDNDSFTGEKCDEPCNNESVVGKNCYRCNRNKKCLECLNKTYYGDYCTDECFNCPGNPGFCYLNGTCEDNSSLCDDDTYYGAGCNISCTKIGQYCKRCNREEKCTECNDTRYHGDKCIEGCDGCSENGCDIQGYCREFECKNGTFGLGCDQNCSCSENSDSLNCGKFGGQCLNCKFGYYGKECADTCTYKCQSKICCIFKQHEKDIESKLELNTNYKYMTIEYNGKKYKIEIDYNYGYPLTLFNESAIYVDCDENSFNKTNIQDSEEKRDIYSENFTNYDIESHIYKHKKILIEGHKIEVDLTIATKVVCKSKSTSKDISGVIGLGFFNSISNSFFMEGSEKYDLNILSYLYYKENNTVKFNFGNMFEEQIDYIERLTSCDVILDTESDIQGKKMKCKLDGIKSAKYSEGYELINASITFSLGEKSSLVLCKGSGYNYLKNVYLKDINCKEQKNNGITSFYCPKDKIHKLSNFGFVFNKFFYSYSPDKFFDGTGDEQKFLVQINDNLTETEFIIGKEFFENIKFTINNEEAKIYFYARNAEISEVLTQKDSSDDFGIHLEARELAGVTLAIIIFLNFAGFGIYYLVKRRKMKSGDYIRIE